MRIAAIALAHLSNFRAAFVNFAILQIKFPVTGQKVPVPQNIFPVSLRRELLEKRAGSTGFSQHAVSDGDLRPDLDSSSRRYMKISAGIVRGPGQTDKQFVLPVGHFRCFGWPQRTS